MKSQRAARWLQYGISFFAGLIIAVLVAVARGFAWGQGAPLSARHFSDGFFVAGLLMAGLGALALISTTGFFDIFSYGVRSVIVLFTPFKRPREHEKYYDYKTARDERRGKARPYLLIAGLSHIALSLVCLALYYNLPG